MPEFQKPNKNFTYHKVAFGILTPQTVNPLTPQNFDKILTHTPAKTIPYENSEESNSYNFTIQSILYQNHREKLGTRSYVCNPSALCKLDGSWRPTETSEGWKRGGETMEITFYDNQQKEWRRIILKEFEYVPPEYDGSYQICGPEYEVISALEEDNLGKLRPLGENALSALSVNPDFVWAMEQARADMEPPDGWPQLD